MDLLTDKRRRVRRFLAFKRPKKSPRFAFKSEVKISERIRGLVDFTIVIALAAGVLFVAGPVLLPTTNLSASAFAANGIRSVSNLCFWEDLSWDELQPAEQKAWRKLGWTAKMWETEADNAFPPSENKDWDELSPVEQRALIDLGYTAKTWKTFDADACP
jgi:hypothetical protein